MMSILINRNRLRKARRMMRTMTNRMRTLNLIVLHERKLPMIAHLGLSAKDPRMSLQSRAAFLPSSMALESAKEAGVHSAVPRDPPEVQLPPNVQKSNDRSS